jgi:predicted transposase YbfD/YdcC
MLYSPHQGQTSSQSLDSVRLFDHFSDLSDPRIDRTKRHSLLDIIGLSICAVICGADGWTAIEEYGHAKQTWLKQFLELPNGIPSDDTLRRVFARLSPTQFQQRFLSWVHAISARTAGQVVAIDGKTLRRSYDRGANKAPIHMISAWAWANCVVLGQLKTEEKSNEITVIPELLNILALEGCIVSIDAMGCQKDIAARIVEQEADYVLALKGNQGATHQNVVAFFDQLQQQAHEQQHEQQHEPQQKPQQKAWEHATDSYETVDGDHGRIEIRRYWQVDDLSWLAERSQWKHLQSVGMVEAERHIGNTSTGERRYYLSSLGLDVRRFAEAVRGHWGIENSLHWVLDVTFREDDSRIRQGYAPENFAVLRHITLNLLRQDPSCKRSINMKRFRAGWDDNYLAHILFKQNI